jgi:selenophosphate synthetase-related protein
MMPTTNTPLCGASRLGDCVADLAVYHDMKKVPRPNGEDFSWFWTWRLGPVGGKVYARREDAIAAVREYIATMTEMSEVAGRVWEDRP